MQKPLALLVIGLFFGTGFGFLISASNGITLDGHSHDCTVAIETMADHDHSHLSVGYKPLCFDAVIQAQ